MCSELHTYGLARQQTDDKYKSKHSISVILSGNINKIDQNAIKCGTCCQPMILVLRDGLVALVY